MPIIKGISFVIFLPNTEHSITTARVTRPQIMHSPVCRSITKEPVAESKAAPPVRSLIALPARERPIIATVGPMTTAGMILFIHFKGCADNKAEETQLH